MLTGMAVLLLVLIVLLAIPVSLTFQLSWRQTLQSQVTLEWLLGLVRIRLPAPHAKAPTPKSKPWTEKLARTDHSSDKQGHFFATIRQKALRRRIIRFIQDCWHAVKKQDVRLRVRVGLGDPADTGQLWAIVGPVAGVLANSRAASIEIEPEFIDAIFELDSSGRIQLIPLQLLYLTIGLLMSPPLWRGIKQMRTAVA